MSVRLRKAEREQLVGLLDAEWQSVDDLAAAVFDAAAGLLLARDWFVLVSLTRDSLMVFGPHGTRARAEKSLGSLEFLAEDSRQYVRKLAVVGDFDDAS